MALADEASRVASQFEFTDSDVNRHVQEFLRQMSTFWPVTAYDAIDWRELTIKTITGEGLEKDGTSLSQIPTYVTGVPNGTEKVRCSGH